MKLASIARFLRRSKRDAESASDLQFYLDTETEDNLARGMPPEEARAAARRKLLCWATLRKASTPSRAPCRTVKFCFIARRDYRQ